MQKYKRKRVSGFCPLLQKNITTFANYLITQSIGESSMDEDFAGISCKYRDADECDYDCPIEEKCL